MNYKMWLVGAGILGTATAAYLSIPRPASTPSKIPSINWEKVNDKVKEDCGDGTSYTQKPGETAGRNNKGYTMSEFDSCKMKIYEAPASVQ